MSGHGRRPRWRWSGGGSQRANSVSTIDFNGNDAARALDQVEARYRAKDSPSQIHTFDPGQPHCLPALLTARGYRMGETTLTMLATIPGLPVIPASAAVENDIVVANDPDTEWMRVYMAAITESRRAVNREILRRIPDPRAFFSVRTGGRVISVALGVVNDGHAVAECVATSQDARRRHGAATAMRALGVWAASLGAHTVGLQVVGQNQPAIALYQRLGFQIACTNRFWVMPRDARWHLPNEPKGC
jgi:GNAT superfamily N-acetyltransferase